MTSARLTPLRPSLRLHPAGQEHGTPRWTLEDPLRHRFYRLGQAEVEMLHHWPLGAPERVAEAVNARTTLSVSAEQVARFARFLGDQQLVEGSGGADNQRLEQLGTRRQSTGKWLLHHYLFIRVPLVRPDRWLERHLPQAAPFFSRFFAFATLLAGLLGLVLALRQWADFRHTLLYFFTLPGATLFALALVVVKLIHELAHAFTCKRYGVRVPTMGVALLLLWPVLYTDTSGAWRLGRRQRLGIGAAGVIAELALAAWATLAWSFLPEGPLKSVAFVLATTTWLTSLAVNLNPFMRFDGYFLLSDLLGVDNLQPRAFALARWRLREALFGFDEAPPEHFPRGQARLLCLYALATWCYRLVVFFAIALLVYHFAFKLLGIALFAVEIGMLLVRPVAMELREWWRRRQRWRLNRRSLTTAAALVLLLALVLIPWRNDVAAPALLMAERQSELYMPLDARVAELDVAAGARVVEGERLIRLEAPLLAQEQQRLNARIDNLEHQLRGLALDDERAATLPVVRESLAGAQARAAEISRQLERLEIRAPHAGVVAELTTPLAAGEWLAEGSWLGTVTGGGTQIMALVPERELRRVTTGDTARFTPASLSRDRLRLVLSTIDTGAVQTLADAAELAAPYGGPIAARLNERGVATPLGAYYRVWLTPAEPLPLPDQRLKGTVMIAGQRQSLLARGWEQLLTVLIREASF